MLVKHGSHDSSKYQFKQKTLLQNRAADFCGIKLRQVIMYINTLYLHLLHSIVSPPPPSPIQQSCVCKYTDFTMVFLSVCLSVLEKKGHKYLITYVLPMTKGMTLLIS